MVTSTASSTKFDTSKIPAQRQFMESKHPEVLYSGAFGAGKSRVGCEKGLFLSIKYPGNKGLIVRKVFSDLRITTMDTWFRYVMPEDFMIPNGYNKQEHLLKLKNGSEVLFAGLDRASKIGSYECGWIFCDEIIEFSEEDYNMLQGRLRHPTIPFHQIFGATNPSHPRHWVFRHFYEDVQAQREGRTLVLESDSTQNPYNPQSYRDRLDTFKGRYKERFVEGKWISFEGLVYDVWDQTKHLIERNTTILTDRVSLTGDSDNPIPSGWEHYRVIDFGFTNPFVCQWWASSPTHYIGDDDRQDKVLTPYNERVWVMYKEIYMSGVTVPDHSKDILKLSGSTKIRTTIADWDSGSRAILERGGIPTIRANKDITEGIQTTYEAISQDRVYILENSLYQEDGELRLVHKPTETFHEFSMYARPVGKNGVRNPKEDPAKIDDHGMDCLRYLLHTLKVLNSPNGNVEYGVTSEVQEQQAGRRQASTSVWSGQLGRTYGNEVRKSWRNI